MPGDAAVLVLGIGNVLWADEGFGVRAVTSLHARHAFPPSVRLMDGGTQGMYLLPYIAATEVLVIIDAVDYGLAPGALHIVRDDEVPRFLGVKHMSLHQTGFQEVLGMAELLGCAPRTMLLVGVQPVDIETYGGGLTPPVAACIDAACDIVVDFVAGMGFAVEPRAGTPEPLAPHSVIGGDGVALFDVPRPCA